MNKKQIQILLTVLAILPLTALTAVCQSRPTTGGENTGNLPKVVNFSAPQRHEIKPESLPKPYETKSAFRASKVVAQPPDAVLNLPKGFQLNVFAEGNFTYPRWMALAPNGDVFVADSRANAIVILRDANKDGVAEQRFTFADNLSQPFGMAFQRDWFYVANTDSVVRFRYKSGQTRAEGAPEKLIELTEGGYNQHWTRNIIFSPDGKKLYVSIGSSGNYQPESDERRAAIAEYDPNGGSYRLYATGLRNPIGLAWNPKTGELWTAVNERDGLGDDLVPDFVTSVKDGGFYGYPYYYIGRNREPRLMSADVGKLKAPIVPDVLVTSHSAALGIVFYDGKMFPKEYQGDAFIALHGSWNRQKLTGYKIIRVRFENGKLAGNGYEDFLTGWLPNENSNEVWGRPVGLLVNSDGSLLIADDGAKKIWRVSYK
ncbi:MAG: sorbosone dehydrogenase family protein [Acidobacteriota bacterium]|nr:sorbosone dehydrogenase family protein [Acidobacteriota bacterium]